MDDKHPLHLAAQNGNSEALNSLLENGRKDDVNETNEVGKTPLHTAVESAQLQCVQSLIKHDADINFAFGTYKRTPLHLAAGIDHPGIVLELLLANAQINVKDALGNMAIHYAAKKGLLKNLVQLLVHHSKINATNELQGSDEIGKTALQLASIGGHADVVLELCNKKAAVDLFDFKIHIEDKDTEYEKSYDLRKTALYYAADAGCVEAVKALHEHGADPNAIAENGWCLLHTAAHEHKPHIITTLCQLGANPETLTRYGKTALHIAVSRGSKECVAALLNAGANPLALNNSDETAVHMAIEAEDIDILTILVPRVDIREANDIDPLLEQVINQVEDVVEALAALKLLITNGCPVEEGDIESAVEQFSDESEIVTLLRKSFATQSEEQTTTPEEEEKEVVVDETPPDKKKFLQRMILEMITEETAKSDLAPPEEEQDQASPPNSPKHKEKLDFKQLRAAYSQRHSSFTQSTTNFFKIIESENFRWDTWRNENNETFLHLLAKSENLSCIVPEILGIIGVAAFEKLATVQNKNSFTSLHYCCFYKNVSLLEFFTQHLSKKLFNEICGLTCGNQGFNVIHCIIQSHNQNQAYILKSIFQGNSTESIHTLNRDYLANVAIDDKVFKMLRRVVKKLSRETVANLGVKPDGFGNNIVMLACYTGNIKLIETSINLLLKGGIGPKRILSPLTKTGITPLEVASAFGNLQSVELILNLLTLDRYDACLAQNEFFDMRNILDWCLIGNATTIKEKQTIFATLEFLCSKLDDRLELALTRKSNLGSLLCHMVRMVPNNGEFKKIVPLAKLKNKLALAFSILSPEVIKVKRKKTHLLADSPTASPIMKRKSQSNKDEGIKLFLLNELTYTPNDCLLFLNFALSQTAQHAQNGLTLHDQFLLAFQDQITNLSSESIEVTHAFLHLASLYDPGRKDSLNEKGLKAFCVENQLNLALAVKSYYQHMDKTQKNGGNEFLCCTFNSDSLLKLIIRILFNLAEINPPAKRSFSCSPINQLSPEKLFIKNFKLMIAKLAPEQTNSSTNETRSLL